MKAKSFLSQSRRSPSVIRERGFSLIELLVVVAIIMSIAVAATPSMVNVISTARMRGNMSSLATFIQQARADAIRENKTRSIYTTLSNSEYIVYKADVATGGTNPAMSVADGIIPMGKQVTYLGTPTGAGAPSVLDSNTAFGSTITAGSATISINSRGMPCAYNTASGKCVAPAAFIWYFVFQPPFGSNRWGAMSISQAGRIKAWYWDGAEWTN